MTATPWIEGSKYQKVFFDATPFTVISKVVGTTTYVCLALPGTGTGAGSAEAVWLIYRTRYDGDVTYTEWAEGDAKNFNKTARDMESYTYL